MPYKFLDAPGHPDGPEAELKEFLQQYRQGRAESAQEPSDGHPEGREGGGQDGPSVGLTSAQKSTLGWEPGRPGKGAIVDGQVHTWPLDEVYMPNHTQYLRERGIIPAAGHPGGSFGPYVVINPAGDIHPASLMEGDDITPFLQADSRLREPVLQSGTDTIDSLQDLDWDKIT